MGGIGKDSKGKSSAQASEEEEEVVVEQQSVELDADGGGGGGGFDVSLLPRGFNFVPDDRELVLGYLLLKVLGEPLHGMESHMKDIPYDEIYRSAPSQDILNSYGVRSYCGNKAWFFFTKKSEIGDTTFGRVRETADKSGHWRVESSQEPIQDRDTSICAYKCKLQFQRHPRVGELKDIRTDWILEEYQIAESFLSPDIAKQNVYGLGKISRLIIEKSEHEDVSRRVLEDVSHRVLSLETKPEDLKRREGSEAASTSHDDR